jgi:hypothetical protein
MSTSGPAKESESQFLAHQAAEAKLAMKNVWAEMKHTLAGSVSVRQWTQRYPWMSTGTALAAGLASGYLLTPRDRDEAAAMWEKFKQRMAKEKSPATNQEKPSPPAAESHQPTIWQTLAGEAVKNLMPLVAGLIGAVISGERQPPAEESSSPESPTAS